MTYTEIRGCVPVNRTNKAHVRKIADSILTNGWQGMPILTYGDTYLITGSHRLAALKLLEREQDDYDPDELGDIAEDVTDEINEYCAANDVTIDELPYDSLSDIFAGTWVERYKDELVEW